MDHKRENVLKPHTWKAEELITEIEKAFPPRDLDGGISLRQALLEDDWEYDDLAKMQEAYAYDITHDWRAIPAEELDAFFNSFSVFTYLDNKGYQYYLPAVLRHSIRNPDSDCSFYLCLDFLKHDVDIEQLVKYLSISPEQSRVITKTLLFIIENGSRPYYERDSTGLNKWIERFGK